jgi:hypothetical protein
MSKEIRNLGERFDGRCKMAEVSTFTDGGKTVKGQLPKK